MSRTDAEASERGTRPLVLLHLRVGWWVLVLVVAVGLGLEALHGLKLGWYLAVGQDTRRLLLTLGHAHGALLAILNIAFAFALGGEAVSARAAQAGVASRLLLSATVLLPGGFLLAGLVTHDGEPGLPILLVPLGGLALFGALLLTVRRLAPTAGSGRRRA